MTEAGGLGKYVMEENDVLQRIEQGEWPSGPALQYWITKNPVALCETLAKKRTNRELIEHPEFTSFFLTILTHSQQNELLEESKIWCEDAFHVTGKPILHILIGLFLEKLDMHHEALEHYDTAEKMGENLAVEFTIANKLKTSPKDAISTAYTYMNYTDDKSIHAAYEILSSRVDIKARNDAYQLIKDRATKGSRLALEKLETSTAIPELLFSLTKGYSVSDSGTLDHLISMLENLDHGIRHIRKIHHTCQNKTQGLAHYGSSTLPAKLLTAQSKPTAAEQRILNIVACETANTDLEQQFFDLAKSINSKPGTQDKLRRYHSSKMNDPSEGRRLLNFHDIHYHAPADDGENEALEAAKHCSIKLNELFDKHYNDISSKGHKKEAHSAQIHQHPSMYITCFSAQHEGNDNLNLWRFYGQEATGCSIGFTLYPDPIDSESKHNDAVLWRGTGLRNIDFNGQPKRPPIFKVIYDDKTIMEVLSTLNEHLLNVLAAMEKTLEEAQEVQKESIRTEIETCIVELFLEIIYLYKDKQYSTEEEWRSLQLRYLDDPAVKMDEAGFLYDETEPFLLRQPDAHIIIGPNHPEPKQLLWELRYRLQQHGLTDVKVSVSDIAYHPVKSGSRH